MKGTYEFVITQMGSNTTAQQVVYIALRNAVQSIVGKIGESKTQDAHIMGERCWAGNDCRVCNDRMPCLQSTGAKMINMLLQKLLFVDLGTFRC